MLLGHNGIDVQSLGAQASGVKDFKVYLPDGTVLVPNILES